MATMTSARYAQGTTGRPWEESYAARLLFTDTVVVIWSIFGSQIAWFGLTESAVQVEGRLQSDFALSYSAVSAVLSIVWIIFLSASGSRDSRSVGIGTTEYRRIVNPSLMLFGLLAIASYLLKIELARGYFVTALPFGLAGLLLSRWFWRKYLISRRAQGAMSSRVVLVGSSASAAAIALELSRRPQAGYFVVGAFLTSPTSAGLSALGIDVIGSVDDIFSRIETLDADTVIVTSSDELPPERMRRLSWLLEPGRQHLVLAPGLIDIAGPRIHTRPVAGLPLIHVETPRYEGSKRAIKRIFDFVASALLLALLSFPLAIVAGLVKLSSPGPILFRQERVGKNGATFSMFKFRSMVVDAEKLLEALSDSNRTVGNEVMFKMDNDPRVTRVGRYLRRLSIDELPQILNVLRGEMSLVGPRPPLRHEVELYEHHVNRRFLVKPGITGLWQVSGRSNLDWESTVRLDLYYVENWSLTGDLIILWRTVSAVLAREGAA